MNQMKLEGLIDQAQNALSRSGLSPITVAAYRRYGFDVIREHFTDLNMNSYSESVADELVIKKRTSYENKEIPFSTWAALRKSAALLNSLQKTGKISLAVLPKWKTVTNPFRQKPTDEQLGNKDDMFALTHLTKQEMAKFGYSDKTTKKYIREGFDPILRYCVQNGITNYSKEKIGEFTNEVQSNPNMSYRARLHARRTALMLDEYYETGSLEWRQLKPEKPRFLTEHFSDLLDRFCVEIRKTDALADSTLESNRIAVRQFLFTLEDVGHKCFDNITLSDISGCITSVANQNASLSYLSNIRKFLRFLHTHNETDVDLSVAIPRIIPPRTVIQEGFTPDEINSLLSCVDRETTIGKRDYAIMMLAAQTGLRAVDIANLECSNIDWRANTIKVTQQKTKRALSLSLPTESGNAIADYILNGRTGSELPFIFLQVRSPSHRLDNKTVGAIVLRYMRRTGMTDSGTCRKGFHSFRRAFGGKLLESETPLEILSELLGHSHINSSKPYLSANETGLKSCALGIIPPEKAGDAQ